MVWIEKKYADYIAPYVRNYRKKSDNLWNFSCPLCKDSQKNKRKARGYLYVKDNKVLFHCHNCDRKLGFDGFLKSLNYALYEEFVKEKFLSGQEKNSPPIHVINKLVLTDNNKHLKGLIKVSNLMPNHLCKKYIISRHIPTNLHYKLFYCSKFKTWTNSIIPDKFKSLENDKPRLIIPLFDEHEQMFAYQGRSLDPNDEVKYITIMLDETKPRLFGLDQVDFNHQYYIFEGPIDAMFIENSIATCGGSLTREMDILNKNTENAIVVYDNEPRSPETCKKVLQAIQKGYKVCVWPDYIEDKDINEMISTKLGKQAYVKTELIKIASNKIRNIIDDNVFSGLEAELRLNRWKRC